VAALVRVAAHLCARPASHRALKLPDRCFFRPAHNREVDHRMRIAPQATNLKETVAGVERVAHGRRGLCRSLVTEQPLVPRLAGKPVRHQPRFPSPLRGKADRRPVKRLSRFGAHSPSKARAGLSGNHPRCGVTERVRTAAGRGRWLTIHRVAPLAPLSRASIRLGPRAAFAASASRCGRRRTLRFIRRTARFFGEIDQNTDFLCLIALAAELRSERDRNDV
jgi:hypothetical protein